jgi:hypothetical protein
MGHVKKEPGQGRIKAGTAIILLGTVGMISAVISFLYCMIGSYGPPDMKHIIWFASGALVFVIGAAVRVSRTSRIDAIW